MHRAQRETKFQVVRKPRDPSTLLSAAISTSELGQGRQAQRRSLRDAAWAHGGARRSEPCGGTRRPEPCGGTRRRSVPPCGVPGHAASRPRWAESRAARFPRAPAGTTRSPGRRAATPEAGRVGAGAPAASPYLLLGGRAEAVGRRLHGSGPSFRRRRPSAPAAPRCGKPARPGPAGAGRGAGGAGRRDLGLAGAPLGRPRRVAPQRRGRPAAEGSALSSGLFSRPRHPRRRAQRRSSAIPPAPRNKLPLSSLRQTKAIPRMVSKLKTSFSCSKTVNTPSNSPAIPCSAHGRRPGCISQPLLPAHWKITRRST